MVENNSFLRHISITINNVKKIQVFKAPLSVGIRLNVGFLFNRILYSAVNFLCMNVKKELDRTPYISGILHNTHMIKINFTNMTGPLSSAHTAAVSMVE